jgi:MATE family multidrug resistance protein
MSEPFPQRHTPGGYRELIALSTPLILSASFWTVQIFADRVFLSWVNVDAVAAAMPAVGYFWTPMALLQFTVMYVTVFVAQYAGAKRPDRIGPVVWQAIYFGAVTGALFPALIPVANAIIAASGHPPEVQVLESAYFTALTLSVVPMLLVSAVNGFFAGRGESWTVLLVNAVGTVVNVVLDIPLIYLQRHDPEAAMFGAGLATALGSVAAAAFGMALFLRRKFRTEYGTLSGWRFDRPLFLRLMKFGIPNGTQWCIEGLAFTVFILIVGNIGKTELAATTITLALNTLAFLPVVGLGQGVEVLVGKRQGEERPDLSARTTWTGAKLATGYMALVAALYCLVPETLAFPFKAEMPAAEWAAVAPLVVTLLMFVAAYSLADGMNITLAYALRGAGDTRFVTMVAIGLSWPLMVVPTYLVWRNGMGVEWAWAAATVYIAATAGVFALRFRGGKWRTMKVIEAHAADPDGPSAAGEPPPAEEDPAKQPAA